MYLNTGCSRNTYNFLAWSVWLTVRLFRDITRDLSFTLSVPYMFSSRTEHIDATQFPFSRKLLCGSPTANIREVTPSYNLHSFALVVGYYLAL